LDGHKIDFDLESFRQRGEDEFADDFLDRLEALAARPIRRGPWPGVPPEVLLKNWPSARQDIVEHYFKARQRHIIEEGEPRPLDVDRLHALLARLPVGRWTTYGAVAAAVGSHPRAVGGHIGNCPACQHAWRVLQEGGRVSPAFRWTDPADHTDPRDRLTSEGVRFVDDRAHPDDRLELGEVRALASSDGESD
jgi:alkylated DNA nucleotide flippase Atl1